MRQHQIDYNRRDHRLATILTAAVVIGLLAFLGVTVWQLVVEQVARLTAGMG